MKNQVFVLSYYNGYYDEWKRKKSYSSYNEVLEFLWKKFTKSTKKAYDGTPMSPDVNGYTFSETIYEMIAFQGEYTGNNEEILKKANSWKEFLEAAIKDGECFSQFCLHVFSSKDEAIVDNVGDEIEISQAQILLDIDISKGLNNLYDFNKFKSCALS